MKEYNVILLNEIDSTNEYLKRNSEKISDFTFVSAKYQTNGKGRYDRVWKSIEGENLLFSLFIKDKNIVSLGSYLSLIASYSVAHILEEKYNLTNVQIKWPNDIYVNDKKICGILLEGELPRYVIIGIGLNVNQEKFIGEYRKEPTSIYLEKNSKIDVNLLKELIFDGLFEDLTIKKDYISYYQNHSYLNHKLVKVKYDNNDIIGVVTGVDSHYNLIIKTKEKEYLISSGEIEIL